MPSITLDPIVITQIKNMTPQQKAAMSQVYEGNNNPIAQQLKQEIDNQLQGEQAVQQLAQQPVQQVAQQPMQDTQQPETKTILPKNNFLKNLGKGLFRGVMGGAEGALLGLQGRPISEHSAFKTNDYEELLKKEMLKNQIDPSKKIAQLELDEVERKKQEQSGIDLSQSNSNESNGVEEVPEMFIKKSKGKNKYGVEEFETVDNPLFKQALDIEKEKRSIDLTAAKAAEKDRQLNISKISRLNNIVDIIEKEYAKTETSGGITGLIRRPAETFSRNMQVTKNQRQDKAYADFAKGMRVQLARAMSEVGNLSELEQQAALDLIPNLLDDPETSKIKLQQLRDLVTTVKENNKNQPDQTNENQKDFSNLW